MQLPAETVKRLSCSDDRFSMAAQAGCSRALLRRCSRGFVGDIRIGRDRYARRDTAVDRGAAAAEPDKASMNAGADVSSSAVVCLCTGSL